MNRRNSIIWLLASLLLFSTGASCPRNRQMISDQAPTVLPPSPRLVDVIRVVNTNSARIQQVQSTSATLTIPGVITPLQASYAFDRPRRFRLRAGTQLTGNELDLGSNDEHYWMWIARNEPPVVHWGRHDQFSQSATREILPVPPHWLIEALGVVDFDPTGQHDGPYATRPGQLEVRSRITTELGQIQRVTILDDTRGWILEQRLYDSSNRELAAAFGSAFQYDSVYGVSLPRQVDIRLPPANLSFTLRTEQLVINQLFADPSQLWTMPDLPGHQYIDLARTAPMQPSRYGSDLAPGRFRFRSQYPRNAAIRRLPPFNRLR